MERGIKPNLDGVNKVSTTQALLKQQQPQMFGKTLNGTFEPAHQHPNELNSSGDEGGMTMTKMKRATKFVKKHNVLQMNPGEPSAKESPNVTKAKHMLYVNQNVDRAFEETTREGFDFRNTRN